MAWQGYSSRMVATRHITGGSGARTYALWSTLVFAAGHQHYEYQCQYNATGSISLAQGWYQTARAFAKLH